MTKVSHQKSKITKGEIMGKIFDKIPSIKLFPQTWRVGRYPRSLNREQIIQLAKELKIITRRTQKLELNKQNKYTLTEKITFTE